MKFWSVLLLFIFFTIFSPVKIKAASWYYPLEKTLQRQSLKAFGQYIDRNFYNTAPDVFPTKFYGYHVGTDWEIFPDELMKEVPVYAVSSGTISYSGTIDGYGGLILEKLADENKTALYGHLKPTSLIQSGSRVQAGEKIAVLGAAYSQETAGERKHLHFGIYLGNDQYFKGYEESKTTVNSKWVNPVLFLKEKGAVEPGIINQSDRLKATPSPIKPTVIMQPQDIIASLLSLLTRLFATLGK
jgi:murein DD-endopeptidase MepM/ murein hydrolase activator NlpD